MRSTRSLSLLDERVRRAYDAGRRAHRAVDLRFERFARYAREAMPKHENGDYYLAVACDVGTPGAWERLQERFRKPLRAMMRRRGASKSDVDRLLEDVWGRLAAPPPRGAARTRMGTYDGQGPLLAWLATVSWRRLTDWWRASTRPAPLSDDITAARADPAINLEDGETERLLGRVLEQAWAALTIRELEVVVLKYRHQLAQTEIAKALRVSPPRVTRLLQSATRRLRAAIEARYELRAHAPSAGSNRAALLEIVQQMLSRTDAELAAGDGHERGSA